MYYDRHELCSYYTVIVWLLCGACGKLEGEMCKRKTEFRPTGYSEHQSGNRVVSKDSACLPLSQKRIYIGYEKDIDRL